MTRDEVLAAMQRAINVASCNSDAHPASRLLRAYAEDAKQARDIVAALYDDAERYRWLRDGCGCYQPLTVTERDVLIGAEFIDSDKLDAAIDAARIQA